MSTPEDVAGEAAVDPGNGEGAITHRLVEEMVPFLRDPRPEIRFVMGSHRYRCFRRRLRRMDEFRMMTIPFNARLSDLCP